jgi:hypothetical protein
MIQRRLLQYYYNVNPGENTVGSNKHESNRLERDVIVLLPRIFELLVAQFA